MYLIIIIAYKAAFFRSVLYYGGGRRRRGLGPSSAAPERLPKIRFVYIYMPAVNINYCEVRISFITFHYTFRSQYKLQY